PRARSPRTIPSSGSSARSVPASPAACPVGSTNSSRGKNSQPRDVGVILVIAGEKDQIVFKSRGRNDDIQGSVRDRPILRAQFSPEASVATTHSASDRQYPHTA